MRLVCYRHRKYAHVSWILDESWSDSSSRGSVCLELSVQEDQPDYGKRGRNYLNVSCVVMRQVRLTVHLAHRIMRNERSS
jgi:hypothetical protein